MKINVEKLLDTLNVVKDYFPIVELQTNGIELSKNRAFLYEIKDIDIVSVSCCHYLQKYNQKIYSKNSTTMFCAL